MASAYESDETIDFSTLQIQRIVLLQKMQINKMKLERIKKTSDLNLFNRGSLQLQQPWIDAFSDPKAEIQTFTPCLALGDLNADGDYKLILADLGNGSSHVKLKVYRGTALSSEIVLLDAPAAVLSIYTDTNEPRIPGIVVACGCHVLVYRNCRPYFKFCLPPLDASSLEADLWRQRSQTSQLVRLLQELSDEVGYSNLSAPSQTLLALEPSRRDEFILKNKHCSIKKQTVVTCMTSIKKSLAEDKTVSCIVLATESCQIFVLDPEAFVIMDKYPISCVASLISTTGLYTVDYRVVIVSRTGKVVSLRGGVTSSLTNLTSHPVGLVLYSQSFITATMDCTLQCFSTKGVKQWSNTLPGSPVTMCSVPLTGLALNLVAVSVATETGGSLLLYSGPQLMHSFVTSYPVSAITFGRYGQEEHALVSVTSGGGLSIKLLKRTAHFGSGEKSSMVTNSQPHNIKLLVPKKSRLFVEQTLRERDQCHEIHSFFQRSWIGLSVAASEAYLHGLQSSSVCQREALKLTAQVLGLGPRLKIQLFLENMANDYVPAGLAITFLYDPKLYTIHTPYIPVPMLVPGLTCCLETLVTCELGIASPLQVLVFASRVLLSAVINMPPDGVCEFTNDKV
ncbi:Bardet-Biedl syndrome 1 [Lycorma delicatula]|uniref:Bardet-Biedl syndrome 1 n=1 Tax=Lycorma delicatula TaxID=130591 RepID=UPI003F5193D4